MAISVKCVDGNNVLYIVAKVSKEDAVFPSLALDKKISHVCKGNRAVKEAIKDDSVKLAIVLYDVNVDELSISDIDESIPSHLNVSPYDMFIFGINSNFGNISFTHETMIFINSSVGKIYSDSTSSSLPNSTRVVALDSTFSRNALYSPAIYLIGTNLKSPVTALIYWRIVNHDYARTFSIKRFSQIFGEIPELRRYANKTIVNGRDFFESTIFRTKLKLYQK